MFESNSATNMKVTEQHSATVSKVIVSQCATVINAIKLHYAMFSKVI